MRARPALAAQPYPSKQRNVVIRLDWGPALRTTRSRRDDRHALWNPRDADVQEAPNDDAEKKKEGDDHISNVPQERHSLNSRPALRVPCNIAVLATFGTPVAARSRPVLGRTKLVSPRSAVRLGRFEISLYR